MIRRSHGLRNSSNTKRASDLIVSRRSRTGFLSLPNSRPLNRFCASFQQELPTSLQRIPCLCDIVKQQNILVLDEMFILNGHALKMNIFAAISAVGQFVDLLRSNETTRAVDAPV